MCAEQQSIRSIFVMQKDHTKIMTVSQIWQFWRKIDISWYQYYSCWGSVDLRKTT